MYIVIELQKVDDTQIANLVNVYTNKNVAEQAYHNVLAAAAVSSLPCHSAVILDETGRIVKGPEYYIHEVVSNE